MKTIDEAAKEHGVKMWKKESRPSTHRDFKAGVEFAQCWIPVEEELPEIDNENKDHGFKVSINVEAKNGIKIQSAYYNYDTNLWRSLITGMTIFPTHWRPINLL